MTFQPDNLLDACTLPDHIPVIGVIGVYGQMGQWFSRFFTARGCAVLGSDRETVLDNATVAARSDVLIVCVPLRATPTILGTLLPHLSSDTLVIDTASLMSPSRPVLSRVPGAACALHPLFGPTTPVLKGQTLVVSPIKPIDHDKKAIGWLAWLVDVLQRDGSILRWMEPDDHDTAMATVQALLHASFVAFASALPAAGTAVADALALATPTMRLYLALMARILNQPADLYADLLTINPAAPAALRALSQQMERVDMVVNARDATACQSLFEQARDALGASGVALIPEAEQALNGMIPRAVISD